MNLERRSDRPEIMDDPRVASGELDRALGELKRINRWLGGYRTTRIGVARLAGCVPTDGTLSVLDIGAGGTDLAAVLRPLHRRFKVTAIDVNPHMREYAAGHSHQSESVTASAHSLAYPDRSFDIVHASLFLHHCTDLEAVRLLRRAARIARVGVVINDLHRNIFALAGITTLTALFARSPIVRHDAKVSVRRAFTRNELDCLLDRAGISAAEISWLWAFRWCIWFPVTDKVSHA